jgi:putative hydrolase of the HAD superfamily
MKFNAVAFDLDGTLYPDYRLYIRLVPFLLTESRLLMAMGKARSKLRKSGSYGADFYETQSALMAGFLRDNPEKVRERAERLIYRGWEPFFKKIRLFPHVIETLDAFRKEGIKTGLLSDFPPGEKLENLKISGYWDTAV